MDANFFLLKEPEYIFSPSVIAKSCSLTSSSCTAAKDQTLWRKLFSYIFDNVSVPHPGIWGRQWDHYLGLRAAFSILSHTKSIGDKLSEGHINKCMNSAFLDECVTQCSLLNKSIRIVFAYFISFFSFHSHFRCGKVNCWGGEITADAGRLPVSVSPKTKRPSEIT